MSYPNALYSAFAFIGFVMCAIPLPWHLQSWNTGTCMFMIWTGLGCLNQFINSIVWNNNAVNWAPVWCDISSRLIVGLSTAIPAASLCINRRLYHISSIQVVTTTKSDKRRQIIVDLAIGVGLPVLGMILYYIPQGHRFDIYEGLGCWPEATYTWPLYPIFYLPPIVIGLISGTYGIFTIISFSKNRSQFKATLSVNSNVTPNRFLRLMCLASVDLVFTIPLSLFNIYIQASTGPVQPWISWENVHVFFSRVDQFPAIEWRSNILLNIALETSRWSIVLCAFVFFGFFGFADEAKKNYRWAFQSVAKRVGVSTASFGNGITSSGFLGSNGMKSKGVGSSGKIRPIIPLFVHQESLRRHDSLTSFTDMCSEDGVDLNQKFDPEKQDSYLNLSIADVGGTLADVKDDDTPLSPAPSSVYSIPPPPPARTYGNSRIEISSVYRDSTYIEPTDSLAVPISKSS